MKTITSHYEWEPSENKWLPVDDRREADNLVLEQLNPDREGLSSWLTMSALLPVLPEAYRARIHGNGSNMFNRGRGIAKDFLIQKEGKGRIVAVRSIGLVPQIERAQSIRPDIWEEVRQQRCAVLGTHQSIEVDHKSGRKNDRRLESLSLQVVGDFQPLNTNVNAVKRTHCRRCLETRSRFDATQLGYRHGWWVGDASWETCTGCYWHDPQRFNAEMSKNFEPR